jgi:transcriptional regulator with XRE-family HTH domain
MYAKRRIIEQLEGWLAEAAGKIQPLVAVEIPTYQAWRAMMSGLLASSTAPDDIPFSADDLRASHQVLMRRHERLSELERTLVLQHARLLRDQADVEERQQALKENQRATEAEIRMARDGLEQERTQLREDVIAGVQRDHAELLSEVGDLERRRRAALAMLPPETPRFKLAPRIAPATAPASPLKDRLAALGITQARIAKAANCSASNVSKVVSGRAPSRRVLAIAEALITEATTAAGRGEEIPTRAPRATIERGPGRLGVGHPALSARLQEAGITHADVASAAGCSRSLVAGVLNGQTAERRGLTTAVVPTAERLLAETTGRPADAGSSVTPRSMPNMREALVRERAELDALRRRMLDEREQITAERGKVQQEQSRVNAERKKLERLAEASRLRHVAAGLPRRLDLAGITRTQLANAARRDISHVSRVLSGYGMSAHVVEVAERLLARAVRREKPRRIRPT